MMLCVLIGLWACSGEGALPISMSCWKRKCAAQRPGSCSSESSLNDVGLGSSNMGLYTDRRDMLTRDCDWLRHRVNCIVPGTFQIAPLHVPNSPQPERLTSEPCCHMLALHRSVVDHATSDMIVDIHKNRGRGCCTQPLVSTSW